MNFPGQPDACFRSILEQHRDSIIRFLHRLVEDQCLAEELAQSVFLSAHRLLRDSLPNGFQTWLFRTAMHLASQALRDGVRTPRNSDDWAADRVRRALAAVPARQRAALLLHKYERLDYTQIARVLDCSDSAVKSLLLRAYQTLHAQITGMDLSLENSPLCQALSLG